MNEGVYFPMVFNLGQGVACIVHYMKVNTPDFETKVEIINPLGVNVKVYE